MKKRWLGPLAALLLGNGLAWSQPHYLPDASSQVLLPETPQAAPVDVPPLAPQPVAIPQIEKKVAAAPAPRVEPAPAVRPIPVPATVVIPSAHPRPTTPCGSQPCGSEGRSAFCQPEHANDRDRVWASAEYLVWWMSGDHLPPLIGTLPAGLAGSVANLPAGAITTVFGDRDLDFKDFSGGRFTAGAWLDPEQYVGVEGSFFFLNRNSRTFSATGTGDPVVGPLFFDVVAGRESIITPVTPSQATETARVSSSERLWGSELSLKSRVCYFGCSPLDILAGFRYMDLQNDLLVNTAVNFTGSGTRAFSDAFAAKNQFYGGQVGAALDLREGAWSLGITGKLGLGGVRETMIINGSTTESPIGFPTRTFPGGILTARSNMGEFSMTRFAVLPEMTFALGYQVTDNFRLTLGYNFLYLSKVIYPGTAVDSVNPANIRGLIVTSPSNVVRPIPVISQSDLWAHGINFGAEVRF